MKKHFDYIIVGQGTAGSVLTYTLIKNGKSVLAIDNNIPITSSKVAAGLFNPITGRKLVKTWLCDEIFYYLHSFYPELEKFLKSNFYNPLNIYIPFDSLEKQNSWMADSSDPKFENYIQNISSKDQFESEIHGGYGSMEITQSGYVLTKILLESFKNYLIEKEAYINEQFLFDDLSIDNNKISWKSITSDKLIFCEGADAVKNSYFKGLDIRETKGEILTIQLDSKIDKLVNRGCWLLPLGNGIYRTGSTYEKNDLTNNPTEKGRLQIIEKLEAVLKTPYKIINQEAAVRPTTYDRRPFIGMHPTYKNIGIFNGFGTKGTSLTPYFANHFYQHIEEGKELMKEVNFMRCKTISFK